MFFKITNDDIENWSLDESASMSNVASSSSSPLASNFAPATSSTTCARLDQSLVAAPELVIISDDEEKSPGRMIPSTSAGSRNLAIKSRRGVRSNARSTYSASVISTDEEDINFANSIKSVAIESPDDRRERSPIRSSGKFKTRRKYETGRGCKSFSRVGQFSESATAPRETVLDMSNTLHSPIIADSNAIDMEHHAEMPSSMLTLNDSIQEVASSEMEAQKPSAASLGVISVAKREVSSCYNVFYFILYS